MKQRLLYLGIACLALLGAYVCTLLPDHFTPNILVRDITREFPVSGCEHLSRIVQKPFSYLGKGSQAIAFESADGRYVLKFFLMEHFHTKVRIRSPFRKLPAPRIRWDVLERYTIAFQELKEETGLVAIHLSANTTDLPSCTLKDPKGHLHVIDLNRFSFLVQKKGSCITDQFHQLSLEQQRHVASSLEALTTSLARKGFYNLRASFKDENFALLDDKALIIDVGNFIFLEEQKTHPEGEMVRAKEQLHSWLKDHYKK